MYKLNWGRKNIPHLYVLLLFHVLPAAFSALTIRPPQKSGSVASSSIFTSFQKLAFWQIFFFEETTHKTQNINGRREDRKNKLHRCINMRIINDIELEAFVLQDEIIDFRYIAGH